MPPPNGTYELRAVNPAIDLLPLAQAATAMGKGDPIRVYPPGAQPGQQVWVCHCLPYPMSLPHRKSVVAP